MRILAGADFHGDHAVYDWFADVAARLKVEGIVLAGDLLGCPDGFSSVEEAQGSDSDRLARLLESIGVPVMYIMGNDDLIEMASSSSLLRPLHMARSEVGRHSFVGYQCSLPFMGGVFEKAEGEISRDLVEIGHLVDEQTVLVTHSPAYGVLDGGFLGNNIGSSSVRDLIGARRPLAHIHGHCHAAFGREGRHFNVASARWKRAMVIDLDTMRHEVVTGA